MKLTQFEIKALHYLLLPRLSQEEWQTLLSNYVIDSYVYTGAGYFLKITCGKISLDKETIHQPVIMGKATGLEVGFLAFVEGSNITIECHSWGEINPPANIRELELEITVEE